MGGAMKKKRAAKPTRAELPPGVGPLLVDRNQAAAMIGVSWLTLLMWSQQGILRPVNLPPSRRLRDGDRRLRRVLYAREDLEKFIADARARG